MTQPPNALAVLTPRWGAVSETFVARHLTEICPGRTTGIVRDVLDAGWGSGTTRFELRSVPENPVESLARAVGFWTWSRRARAVRRWLEQSGTTAVLGEWLNFSAKWFPVLQRKHQRFVAHAHGYDVTARALKAPLNRWLYRRLQRMDAIVTVSELTRQRLQSACGIAPEKLHVIPCGVEIPPLVSRAPTAARTTLLCVGRMTPKKGQLHTLRAFERAAKTSPALRLEFIGEGPLLESCRTFCAERGLQERVVFHGRRPHAFVQERLRAADMFVLHSLTAPDGDEEGLPVALLEAMAHGLPVISTRHAGIPEAVEEGRTGWLVAEKDWEAMGECMKRLGDDPHRRLSFGSAARQRAASHFSAAMESRRLAELLFPLSHAT